MSVFCSEVIAVHRTVSNHDATTASMTITFNFKTSYQRDVWIYIDGNFHGFNDNIDNTNWDDFLWYPKMLMMVVHNLTSAT